MIEPSEALMSMETFYKSLEKKAVEFPIIDKPVFARPLNCEQMDVLNKHSGFAYNVRMLQQALVYEDGTPVFKETDIFRMLKCDPGIIARTAAQVSAHVLTSFDALKN